MDADPEKIGTKVGNLVVGDSKKLPALIKQNKIDIGIIAVSASAAQAVADSLIDAGIRAILNFAPISIKAPDNVQVKSENTAIEIESLSYFLNQGK